MGYYFRDALSGTSRTTIINRMVAVLENRGIDAIVVTGMSGAVIGAIVAERLNVSLVIVRKPTEKSHSYAPVTGDFGKGWAFIDDFVDSGDTLRRVKDAVGARSATCVGMAFYIHSEMDPDIADEIGWTNLNELYGSEQQKDFDNYVVTT